MSENREGSQVVSARQFVHLHLHTTYSLLDGAQRIGRIDNPKKEYGVLNRAKELGMPAVAMTDHGNMFGTVDFYKKAHAADIKPILGCEVYMAPGDRRDKEAMTRDGKRAFHFVLLAQNELGYRNLCKLVTAGYFEGFYYNPRIDKEILREHADGLIGLSACLAGELAGHCMRDRYEEALATAKEFQEILDGRYFIELQMNGIEEQLRINPILASVARDLDIPLVATNDVHYTTRADAEAQDVLMAIQMRKCIDDPNRLKHEVDEFYLKSADEMYEQFADYTEACDNTLKIAEMCNVELPLDKHFFPVIDLPDKSLDNAAYLAQLSRDGLDKRWRVVEEDNPPESLPALRKEYDERLEYELKIVESMGFSDYFLIVADFINWAKDHGIPVGPGRGCLTGNTPVMMADGTHKALQNIEIGDLVFSHKGKVRYVTNTMSYDIDESLYRIETYYGDDLGITMTHDHKVFAEKAALSRRYQSLPEKWKSKARKYKPPTGNVSEIPAEELSPGDWIYYPRLKANVEIESGFEVSLLGNIPRNLLLDEDFLWILGKWVADGWINQTKRRELGFCFHSNEKVERERLERWLSDNHIFYQVYPHANKQLIQIEANSETLCNWFLSVFPSYQYKSETKTFPNFAHKISDDLLAALLRGYISGDGHLANGRIRMTTVSSVLARQIKQALHRLNIPSSIKRYDRTDERQEFSNTLTNYVVTCPALPPIVKEKVAQANYRYHQFDHGIMCQIKSIEEVHGVKQVYDITVEYDHSYMTYNGAVHNSAAGSLVAYAMRITDIDPIKHDLLFERFLNPERVSMPDIDVDFCEARREEVIEYVRKKYAVPEGPSVAQIITFGKLKAKAVVRDVGRAFGMSFSEVDKIAKLIPTVLDITLTDAIQQEPRLKKLIDSDPKVAKLIDIGQRLEGLNRHASIHAAGVVISDGRPLDVHLPLYKGAKDEVVTQFDMNGVEAVGLIKFDFLGLKNLTLIANCLRIIEQTRGEVVNIDRVPLDAPKAFDLLCAGDTVGVFQLESSGMREVMKKLKPSVFDDVIALVALYRPGPLQGGVVDSFINRKHGREEIKYIFKELEPILKATYGVCIYQEQVMQIANVIASYSLGEADMLRRAMGKKKVEEMLKQRKRFMDGAEQNGFDAKKAEELFDTLEQFAKYGFNKCLVGDTAIMDAETGTLTTIEELYQNRRPFVIHALGEDMKLHTRRVTDVIDNGRKPVFEVKTALGKKITATGNHPFRTLNGWTLLEKLVPGDRIAAPRNLPVESKVSWSQHELVTLAGLLAEGNTCHPSVLYFYSNSTAQVDDFAQAIQQFPNTVARIHCRADNRLEVCASTGLVGGSAHVARRTSISGNLALQAEVDESPVRSGAFLWAQQLGLLGHKATTKHVPSEVFTLCDDDIALFLGRLWSGDGYISGRSANQPPFYATSSEQLARDVQLLLLRLAIPGRIHEKIFKYRNQEVPGFTVHLIGSGSSEAFLEKIAPHIVDREDQVDCLRSYLQQTQRGRESKDTIPADVRLWVNDERQAANLTWRELEQQSGVSTKELYGKGSAKKKGFRRSTIEKLAKFFASTRLKQLANSDVYWDTIVSITPKGIQNTYDLTVEEDHNFVADGLIVHNSHSAAYGFVAYQTAWLKAYYRCEYMAALFTADSGNSDKMLVYLNDCAKAGIEVMPPDINESSRNFAVVDGNIRFGLSGVKNVGEGAIDAIIETREADGPFQSFVDFCERIDYKRVNRRVVESLIKCGAFDSMGETRAALFQAIEGAMAHGQTHQKEKASAQISLFGGGGGGGSEITFKIPPKTEWIDKVLLAYEKEVLGFYISGHPLNRYRNDLDNFVSGSIAELQERKSGGVVSLAGIVTSRKDMTTKRGDRMAFVVVEDLTGTIEVSLFPEAFRQAAPLLDDGQPLLIKGDLECGDRSVKLLAKEVLSLAEVRAERAREIHLKLSTEDLGNGQFESLLKLFQEHKGHCVTYLHVQIPERSETTMRLPPEWNLRPVEELIESLERLFGTNPTYLR